MSVCPVIAVMLVEVATIVTTVSVVPSAMIARVASIVTTVVV